MVEPTVVDWISHMATFESSFLKQKNWWFFLQPDLHNARSSPVVYWYLNYGCLSADFGWSVRNYENKDWQNVQDGMIIPMICDLDGHGTNGIVSPLPLLWKLERWCSLSLAFPQLLNDMLHHFFKSCQLDSTCNHITWIFILHLNLMYIWLCSPVFQ